MDQLVEIIKVLGTPTREEIKCMNPNYTEFKFPQIKAHPWHKASSLLHCLKTSWEYDFFHSRPSSFSRTLQSDSLLCYPTGVP